MAGRNTRRRPAATRETAAPAGTRGGLTALRTGPGTWRGSSCETKPIPTAGLLGGAMPGMPRGQMCKTKPVCRTDTSGGAAGIHRAKQTQFRRSYTKGKYFVEKELCWIGPLNGFGETNPIPGAAGCTWACGTTVMGCVQTKPISGAMPIRRPAFPLGERAKQSQFRARTGADGNGPAAGARRCETNPIRTDRNQR